MSATNGAPERRTRRVALADLDRIPRLGLVDGPTPVTALPTVAEELGLEFFGVKRDDLGEALFGGNKPRKLDYVLAAPPFDRAEQWTGGGGIGSGALVALTAAAAKLGRTLDAHVFWTDVSDRVLENLAFTTSGPTRLHFYASRIALALRAPSLFGLAPARGRAIVPTGATSGLGMVGFVRAGLELATQIDAGELPAPDRIYVALGSGGTAAGLAVGLGLAGVRTTVAAVAVVERAISTQGRLDGLVRDVSATLAAAGIDPGSPAPLEIDRAAVGAGYATSTRASLAACARYGAHGLELDAVYTGKAMAALEAATKSANGVRRVLFWQTARRGPVPVADDWRARLPPALARALADPGGFRRRIGRRRAMVAVGAAISTAAVARGTGYPPAPGWPRRSLAAWEVSVVSAAAEALFAGADTAWDQIRSVAEIVDPFVAGMSPEARRDVHALLALVEHGTPLGGHVARFTHLSAVERAAYLAALEARGGALADAARGLRDLCVLGFYAQPSTWAAIGYDGPRQPVGYDPHGPERWSWPTYDAMVAPRGAAPTNTVP